jgi:RimJ/RimL family protein N-acetyltransferase
MVDVPVIETERLRLRGHGEDDLAAMVVMWSDPRVARFICDPMSEQEVWSKLLRYVGHWALKGYGYWLIEEKESRRFLGEAGFGNGRRAITPSLDGMPEVGWGIVPEAWGKGFASEAVRAVLAWGDKVLAVETVCMIHPDNARSIQVADGCGFRKYARTTFRDEPQLLFRRKALGVS